MNVQYSATILFTNKQNNITIACIAYKSMLNVRYITEEK